MAGYGNRTAPDLSPEDLKDHHDGTRLGVSHSNAYSGGHETYGSGATGTSILSQYHFPLKPLQSHPPYSLRISE